MKFYRVHVYRDGGNCGGFEWFTTRREAERFANKDRALDPDEIAPSTDEIHIKAGKAALLTALRRYASHPDNG